MIKQKIIGFALAIAFVAAVPCFFGFFATMFSIVVGYIISAYLSSLLFLWVWGVWGAKLSMRIQSIWCHVLVVGGPALIYFSWLNSGQTNLLFSGSFYYLYLFPILQIPYFLLSFFSNNLPGSLINITAGVIGVALMAGVYFFFCYRHKKRTQSDKNEG